MDIHLPLKCRRRRPYLSVAGGLVLTSQHCRSHGVNGRFVQQDNVLSLPQGLTCSCRASFYTARTCNVLVTSLFVHRQRAQAVHTAAAHHSILLVRARTCNVRACLCRQLAQVRARTICTNLCTGLYRTCTCTVRTYRRVGDFIRIAELESSASERARRRYS